MQRPLLNSYDFVVIGAGPAGLLAALRLASDAGNYSVALLDKRDPWREPVACAEGVHRQRLAELVPKVEEAWIREPVDGVIFISPNGTQLKFEKKGSGYIIDRALMHKNLAEECEVRGVHCNFRSRVLEVSPLENGLRRLQIENEHRIEIKAKVVIDASGPGAGFGKAEALVQGDYDVEPALFAMVEGLEYPTNYIQLFFGSNYAPGGYAWLFPRDDKVANIGLVVGRKFAKNVSARKCFQDFLKNVYPKGKVLLSHGGAIPCGQTLNLPLARNNLYKAGDAANMVHPISRAGILEAMTGGDLAARAALQTVSLLSETERQSHYENYRLQWMQKYGRHHYRVHRAKEAFTKIPDATFDKAAERLAKLPLQEVTMGKIVFATLWSTPSILWRLRSLFLP